MPILLGDLMFVDSGYYKVAIDSKDDADFRFVSHAHSDHTAGIRNGDKILASSITAQLLSAKGKSVETLEIPKGAELLNAGHVLGSRQLFIENYETGLDIAYTGDYQMAEPLLAEKIETRHADVVILDSTYPYENLVFDDKNEVVTAIQHYVNSKINFGSIIFKAYSLGRAQELIKIMNEIGIVPTVSEEIAKLSKVYVANGIRLYYSACEPGHELKGNFVGIFTNSDSEKIAKAMASNSRRFFTAVATGWAKIFKFNTNVQFALSDHADFRQATEYIAEVDPKAIIPVGTGAEILAKRLIKLGYNAFDSESLKAYEMLSRKPTISIVE
ncbi:MAG: hypothetical protein ACP5MC_01465 [Candidatus Micrarchaeia archaeon]